MHLECVDECNLASQGVCTVVCILGCVKGERCKSIREAYFCSNALLMRADVHECTSYPQKCTNHTHPTQEQENKVQVECNMKCGQNADRATENASERRRRALWSTANAHQMRSCARLRKLRNVAYWALTCKGGAWLLVEPLRSISTVSIGH